MLRCWSEGLGACVVDELFTGVLANGSVNFDGYRRWALSMQIRYLLPSREVEQDSLLHSMSMVTLGELGTRWGVRWIIMTAPPTYVRSMLAVSS